MSEKRKIPDILLSDSLSSSKQQKRWDWNDDQVGCTEKTAGKMGITTVETYEAIGNGKRSLEDIKRQINNSQCHSFWGKNYFYYTGFKKGLTTFLSRVHQDNVGYHAFLIHGVPRIGKSCLAKNIAYHLASAGTTAIVVRMDNSTIFSPDHVTRSLRQYMVQQEGWVIIDQCNVNHFDSVEFLQHLLGSTRKTPIIMFTSGDFEPPGQSWTQSPINFSVIDLQVDQAGVKQVKELFCNNQVQATDILEISAVMGHVLKCIADTRIENTPVTLTRLEECVYEISELSSNLIDHPSIFWILWPEFCSSSAEDIAKRNKPKDWTLDPPKVQVLRSLLSTLSDPQYVQSRLFVNWLHIDGDGKSAENQNDGFFEHTNYYYYFPCLEKFHQIISEACAFSPKDMFNKLLDFYQLPSISTVCARAVEGNLFESLIRLQCQIWAGDIGKPTGLIIMSTIVSSIVVDDILTPSTVADLCDIAETKRAASSRMQVFWCDLNSKGNNQFPGYDFALLQVENAKYVVFQLFKATVNAGKHKTGSMLSVLKEIRKKCKSSNFAAQGNVLPYFLCPFTKWRANDEFINLESGSNCAAQVVNMSKFVKRL